MIATALHAALRAHTAWDAVEAEHRRSMLDLLAAAADPSAPFDPCDKTHFAPGHFTASAVVLSPDASSMLMIHHRRLERWLQPGGHIEPGDVDTQAASAREAAEETGQHDLTPLTRAPFDVDVHTIPASGTLPRHRHHDVRHAFRASHDRLTAASDVKDARWIRLDELIRWDDRPSIQRIALKLNAHTTHP